MRLFPGSPDPPAFLLSAGDALFHQPSKCLTLCTVPMPIYIELFVNTVRRIANTTR